MRLRGRVIEKWSNVPVAGAVVTVNGITVLTGAGGNFAVDTQYSLSTVQVLHTNHEAFYTTVMLSGAETNIEITMTPIAGALR